MASRLITRAGWPEGMDNVHADHELKSTQLRRAVNMDVLDSGKLRMRKGYTSIATSLNAHSLWGDGGSIGYYVDNGVLTALDQNLAPTAIAPVVNPNEQLHYARANNEVYFTAPSMRGRLVGSTLLPWGMTPPLTAPTVAAGVGFLDPGVYTVAITYVDAAGRESASSTEVPFTLAAPGSVDVSWAAPPAGYSVNVYCTAANGEVLNLAASITVGTMYSIIQQPSGRACATQYKVPPPFGTILAYFKGRMFIAVGSTLWMTDAFNFDLVDRRKGFYQFGAPITIVAAVPDGLYVCADKTYFIAQAGTPEATQTAVFDDLIGYPNTLCNFPGTNKVIWLSPRGAVVGDVGGQATVFADGRMMPGEFSGHAAMVREDNSVRQYVVVGQRVSDTALEAATFLAAETIRRAA